MWTELQRTQFLKRAIDIIGRHAIYGVACAIPCDSYREVSKADVLNKVGDHAVFFAMQHIIQLTTALQIPDGISFVFDERAKAASIANADALPVL